MSKNLDEKLNVEDRIKRFVATADAAELTRKASEKSLPELEANQRVRRLSLLKAQFRRCF